jgi:hypothetical protein
MELVAAGISLGAVVEGKQDEAMTASMEAFAALGVSRELWEAAVIRLREDIGGDEYRSGPGEGDDVDVTPYYVGDEEVGA